MSSLDDKIAKIPRPLLVVAVLVLGLAFIVSQNPMQDGCEIQIKNYTRDVKGLLVGFKNKSGKIQPAQIDIFRNMCRQGNSVGSCENYYSGLKKIVEGLKSVDQKCTSKLLEAYPALIRVMSNGIQVMALNAWGEKPPASVSDRVGWIGQSNIYTFCHLRHQIERLASFDEYKKLRNLTYQEFPDEWPAAVPIDKRVEVDRPKALKTPVNTKGSLSEDEVFKRSLFSIRCDLYY